ncbi:MAG: DUF427 domain-containing protein [Acidimicrobiales bacterium]
MEPERIEPGPGQESVWDYPRPPALERTSQRLRVVLAGRTIADTTQGWRVLETSQPPAYYFPPADVDASVLVPSAHRTFCEWKGQARYWSAIIDDREVGDLAWGYDQPQPRFAEIAGHLAFYAQKADACFVDDEQVAANAGAFYGGWITSAVVGPFKGATGSAHW